MLSNCRKGRINKVLVKSLSRFSRNTKDCLASLRELMSLGVTVQFEKENIDTETLTTEFLVSVFGALAQQESVSISENGRQGFRRRMELGQFITTKGGNGPPGQQAEGDAEDRQDGAEQVFLQVRPQRTADLRRVRYALQTLHLGQER
nr:recombinase family protein [uncultured Oscillibacter sp.]